jgi:hypothetical protein
MSDTDEGPIATVISTTLFSTQLFFPNRTRLNPGTSGDHVMCCGERSGVRPFSLPEAGC